MIKALGHVVPSHLLDRRLNPVVEAVSAVPEVPVTVHRRASTASGGPGG